MPRQLVECVPNFSEGRDLAKIDAIVQAILAVPEVVLLDREADSDHNRSVLTFVGPPAAVADAAFRAVERAVSLIDLTQHHGAHPRIGAADVVPFIPIEGVTLEECVKLSERLGSEIWSRLKVPVYLYESAALGSMVTRLAKLDASSFEDDRRFFTEAVDRDAEAFNLVMAAYKRPKAERAPFVEEALHGAAEVPLQVMERVHALQARLHALEVPAKFGSDLAVAKALVVAAFLGALENVKINLDSMQDAHFKDLAMTRMAVLK